ncbi:hypothetical protein FSP39_010506 [Pinctada imbricata]|uniref:Uncharacterized protein n=1 Tax=Pinctada imbricata TaxID=66713 RepID=A0AA88XR23_PINIB|nr:hypothetical protein FSP39_010506 [Pinctada imbricata]
MSYHPDVFNAHCKLREKITLEYLAPNVSRGLNRQRFRAKARLYLANDVEALAREKPDEIMEALEAKSIVGVGRYEILKEIVRGIDVRMVQDIEETEAEIRRLGGTAVMAVENTESDDPNAMDYTYTCKEQSAVNPMNPRRAPNVNSTHTGPTPVINQPQTSTSPTDNQAPQIPHDFIYRVSPDNRGRALIFNMANVTNNTPLPGYHQDASRLRGLLTRLGFAVDVFDDKRRSQVFNFLRDAQNDNHEDFNAFICCFLTHGDRKKYDRNDMNVHRSNENYIFSADHQEIYIEDIVGMFNAENCPSLNGKPKLFLIQACRGTESTQGLQESPAADHDHRSPEVIPHFADTLLFNSTVQNKMSYVGPGGSRFIQSFCDMLENYHRTLDLMTICTFVCNDVAEKGTDEKQMPEIRSTLRKLCYFR